MVRSKYQSVLDLGEQLNIQNGDVKEENGVLHISGTATYPHDKNRLWDAIKAAGGENPSDIVANISIENESIYAKHTVAKGESLSKIAKHYYDNAMKYTSIFEANRGVLNNPDVIQPGQELVIPNI